MDKLVIEDSGNGIEIHTKLIEDPEKIRPLLSKDCMKIFSMLKNKPSYPALIAKESGINEQKVYYYIKQLKNAGIIEVGHIEERSGASAKYYSVLYDSFSFVPERKLVGNISKVLRKNSHQGATAPEFLSDFMKNGIFNAKIVVGSPDPHGAAKARARDGHLAAEVAAFIGANCAGFEFPLVFLDTMIKDLKNESSNLIILGGPVTNKIAQQLNEFLKVKFVASGGNWNLVSASSKKQYNEESIGVIEKLPHPYFKGKWILLIAGKRNSGTISAILALTKKPTEISKGENSSGSFARVVEGLDTNADGLIDEIEFRE